MTTTLSAVASIVNAMRTNKNQPVHEVIAPSALLREDLGFDSMDLAEFTVRVEEAFGVDIFADGVVSTVQEVLDRLPQS